MYITSNNINGVSESGLLQEENEKWYWSETLNVFLEGYDLYKKNIFQNGSTGS